MIERIERIKQAVEHIEKCRATHIQSLVVKERVPLSKPELGVDTQMVWEGVIETFDLHDHSRAKRAYAWELPPSERNVEPNYTVVLGIPPVNSANDAIKAAIMAAWKGRSL